MRRLSRAKVLWAIRSIGWICGSRSGSRLVSVYNSSASQGVQPVQSRELRLLHDQRKQCQLRQAVVQQQSGLPAAHAAIGFPDHVLEEKTGDREQFLAVQKLLTVRRFSRKRENEMLFDVAGVKLRLVRVNHGSVGRRP